MLTNNFSALSHCHNAGSLPENSRLNAPPLPTANSTLSLYSNLSFEC